MYVVFHIVFDVLMKIVMNYVYKSREINLTTQQKIDVNIFVGLKSFCIESMIIMTGNLSREDVAKGRRREFVDKYKT